MALISVIIPIYNAEEYLDSCIESIVNQTYKELEIILIDDGSADRSSEMCDEWAKKDSRIKVIHTENGGGARARNFGLDAATGDYIAFVDSDDIIHPEMYDILYNCIIGNNCDVAECSYSTEYPLEEKTDNSLIAVYNKEETVRENICGKHCQQLIWNKLYKREIVGDIRFTAGKLIDDEFFVYKVLGNSNKTAVINSKLYFYRQQENSVMHRKYSLKRLAAVEAKAERAEYIKDRFPKLYRDACIIAAGSCIYNGQMCLKNLSANDIKTAFEFLVPIYKSYKIKYPDLNKMIFKHKIWYMIANISLKLCCRMRNMLNIGF